VITARLVQKQQRKQRDQKKKELPKEKNETFPSICLFFLSLGVFYTIIIVIAFRQLKALPTNHHHSRRDTSITWRRGAEEETGGDCARRL